jgi:hypothetical protein
LETNPWARTTSIIQGYRNEPDTVISISEAQLSVNPYAICDNLHRY